ncbi:uncharacterized protein [Henckelia pumila]|uniref:uncharacterized protein n=1 Tax=Henckelia pumila TaxID=405737 RepID=UPI003C6E5E97
MEKLVFINYVYSMVLCLLFLYIGTAPATYTNNETDFSALLAFKNRIDDDPLGSIRSWNETEHFCDWEGILCSTRHRGRVVSINLMSRALVGSLSPHLGNLSFLREFVLQNNSFYGEIPEEFGRLRRLELVEFSNNSFSGEIPRNLSKCNDFVGNVPVSLSNASFLERLYLSSSKLTGKVLIDFKRLSALQVLLLYQTSLEGDISFISSLTNCTNLEVIDVGGSLFSGSLPDSIDNLSSKLSLFNIGENQIHGTIPSGIQNLIGLTRLVFDANLLQGSIPTVIGNLYKLQEIYIGANQLTNEIPSSLGNLNLLTHIYLADNNFYGEIPRTLSNCLSLTLSLNNLSGSIPQELASLSSIWSIDLSHNAFTGYIPVENGSLINLSKLDLFHNRLYGPIPKALSSCVVLERLYLRNNSLGGEIPTGLVSLQGLQELDLSQNNLSGSIPSFLGDMLNLKSLNLSFNKFQGEVPTQGVFLNKTAISLEGNDHLCGGIGFLKIPPCKSTNFKKKHASPLLKILISALGTGTICVILWASIYKLVYRRRISQQEEQNSVLSVPDSFLRLSYADLLKATDGFSATNLLGCGRFGSVYRGILILEDKQMLVAVKVFNLEVKGASKSFITECKATKGIRHRNLVKILSVCESTNFQGIDFMAVVYELMCGGSLEEWLHKDDTQEESGAQSKNNKNLSITQRLNIVIDIASAVEYLHCGNEYVIIHGDLKPSNILLDENVTAHVGDFGLTKVMSSIFPAHEGSSSSMAIKGTIGYIPPEYGTTNNMTIQGDVYSFGILVLEMFTNIRPTDDASLNGRSSLHHLVSQDMSYIMNQIFVHELDTNNSRTRDCVTCVLEIGVACSLEFPKHRMMMSDVVRDLNKIQKAYLAG